MLEIVLSFLATFVIYASIAINNILSARYLGPYEFGILNIIYLWPIMIFSFGSIGIPSAIVYFSASKKYTMREVITSIFVLVILLSLLMDVIGYLILPLLLRNQDKGVISSSQLYLILFIPLIFFLQSFSGVIQGNLKMVAFNLIRPLYVLIPVIGNVALIIFGRVSYCNIMWTSIAGLFLTALFFFVYLLFNRWVSFSLNINAIKDIIGYGIKVQLGSIASYGNLRLDQMLISIISSPANLGLYSAIVTISATVFIPSQTINFISLPKLASISSEQERNKMHGMFIRIAMLLTLIGFSIIFITLPWILKNLYGKDFLPVLNAGRILLLGSLILSLKYQLEVGFRARNLPMIPSNGEIISIIVTIIFLFILLPKYGIWGAVITSIFAYSISTIYLMVQMKSKLNTSLWPLLTRGNYLLIKEKNTGLE